MSVHVKLNTAAIAGLEQTVAASAMAAVQALHGEVATAAVMPFDTGNMQNNQTQVTQIADGDEIHTLLTADAPQSRRLYYHPEYHFQTVNNANARGKWWADWLPGGAHEDFLQNTFAEQMKGRMPK